MSEEDNNHRVECFRQLAAGMNLGHSGVAFGVAYVVAFSGYPRSELLGVLLVFYACLSFLSSIRLWWDDRQDRKEKQLLDELKEDLDNE